MRKMTLIGVLLLASAMECAALPPEDEATMRRIVRFLMPQCGGNRTTRVEYIPELIDVLNINGDTNRLARLLAELAQTNSAWYAKMAMWQLEKYGTEEQLPFLYSCATNPAVANRAVNAVLRIEGVSSNSVEAASQMFSLADLPLPDYLQVTETCFQLMKKAMESGVGESCRSNAMSVVNGFATGERCNYYIFDRRRIEDDPTYGNSRRRLSYLRQIGQRSDLNEFQANYVTNAINELVAYPEANLPD